MISLEEKLEPSDARASTRRDLMGLSLLLAMTLLLLPSCGVTWSVVRGLAGSAEDKAALAVAVQSTAMKMACYCLLPAMGFLLCLRRGAIDLSVWVNMSVGGVVAAQLLASGVSPSLAFCAAAGVGLATGTISGLLVALLRWPSPVVTLGMSLAIALVSRGLAGGTQRLPVRESAFADWYLLPGLPLATTGALFVAGIYCAALSAILVLGPRLAAWKAYPRSIQVAASMALSGLLSALGGTAWLITNTSTPLPTNPVGDLRIPAAALLAGGLLLAGRGRTLLSLTCLPVAMLLATTWRLEIVGATWGTVELHMVLLLVMTAVAHLAIARGARWASPRGTAAMYLAMLGPIVVAASGDPRLRFYSQIAIVATGVGLWLLGASLLLFPKKAPSPPAQGAG